MEEHQNDAWRRMEMVIGATKARNANSFAHLIGLKTPEALYRIKKGKNGISKALARRICEYFPQFEVSWLVSDGKTAQNYHRLDVNNRLVALPLYKDIQSRIASDRIYLPETLTKGTEIALFLQNDLFYPMLCKGLIVLFKKSDDIFANGNVHLIYTTRKSILCSIRPHSDREKIVYTPLEQEEGEEIIIDRSTIKEVFVACGVYLL